MNIKASQALVSEALEKIKTRSAGEAYQFD